MINENGIIENAGTILPLVMIIIIGTFLFYQRIKVLKIEHSFDLDEALSVQRMESKAFYENVIANIQRVNNDKIRDLVVIHERRMKNKQEELENDFLQKLRMLKCNHDNILTNFENKIPIMSFAVESSENVRFRMPDKIIKPNDKLYRSNGYVFSFSDADMLSHGQVFKLLQTEVAKWLIENAMVIGKFNRQTRQVDFILRYLQFPA